MENPKMQHTKMVYELSQHLDKDLDNGIPWKTFIGSLGFNRVESLRSKDIFDVFEKLMVKGQIDYGRYDKVRESLQGLNPRACEVIDRYEKLMKGRQDKNQKKNTHYDGTDDGRDASTDCINEEEETELKGNKTAAPAQQGNFVLYHVLFQFYISYKLTYIFATIYNLEKVQINRENSHWNFKAI